MNEASDRATASVALLELLTHRPNMEQSQDAVGNPHFDCNIANVRPDANSYELGSESLADENPLSFTAVPRFAQDLENALYPEGVWVRLKMAQVWLADS